MRRQLSLFDCFGIGINGIIGSGIFLLPTALHRRAGGRSPIAWLIAGALCVLVALCFAEAAGRTEKSGGPYRYACDAFGPHVGFGVGWVTLASTLFGYAAVSRGFAEHAALLIGGKGSSLVEGAIAVLLVVFLSILNIFGVKSSARTSDAVGVVKMLALLAFVVVGLMHVRGSTLTSAPVPHAGETTGIAAAAFAGLFACTGFEYVPVPAGETINPKRTVGLAMVLSVVGATIIYALIQIVAMSTAADLAESKTPLVDAARGFAGSMGATVMAGVAVISAFGFCASSALIGPRYVESFAQDRFLPGWLEGRHPRLGTPVSAIVVSSLLVMVLAVSLDFSQLADTSVIAVVVQYVSTCVSILVMRRREPRDPNAFRIPFGYLVPVAAITGSVLFLFSVAVSELWLAGGLLGGGLVVGMVTRRTRPAPAPSG